jgi:uncharacterized protein
LGRIELLIKVLANKIQKSDKRYDAILGITNGGIIPARHIARDLDLDQKQFIPVRGNELQSHDMPQEAKNTLLWMINMILMIHFSVFDAILEEIEVS